MFSYNLRTTFSSDYRALHGPFVKDEQDKVSTYLILIFPLLDLRVVVADGEFGFAI